MKLPRKESETVEFKSSFDKEAIETIAAFANTRGGTVYVGVSDKGEATGVAINKETLPQWLNQIKHSTTPELVPVAGEIKVNGKSIVMLTVPEYPIKPVSCKRRYFKRHAHSNHALELQEISNLYLQSFNASWDCYPANHYSLENISLEKVNRFIALANKIRGNAITDDPMAVLRKFDLLRGEQISNACHLLFASEDVFQASVQVGRFADATTIKDDITIRCDALSQVDHIFEAVKKHLNKELIITGKPQRDERWQYPLDALREIIINMIVHRNYQDSGDSIIKIFDDRIEFFNPGSLLPGISVAQLLSGNYTSHVRNKKIAAIFKEAGIIEQYGSGITRIIKTFVAEGHQPPKLENFQHGFRITVTSNVPVNVPVNVPENAPETRLLRILSIIEKTPTMTVAQLARIITVSEKTIKRDLETLKATGRISRQGPDKGGRWEVIR